MRIGWGLKVKESACHGIEPELPQDGAETVQVRKVLALDALALYRYCSGLEKRRRRRSTPVTCCQITLNIFQFHSHSRNTSSHRSYANLHGTIDT